MSPSGISQKTEIYPATLSSAGTIPAEPSVLGNGSSLGPEKKSFSEQTPVMLSLFGELLSTEQTTSKGSNALSSAMRVRFNRPSLSDKLTQSLISAGLVRGTTPSWIRKQSGAAIRDSVSLFPDGGDAGDPARVCSFSRGCHD